MKLLHKTYNNIFSDKGVNGDVSKGAPDPFIFKWNGNYYLLCTRPKGLVMMKSFDLVYWKNVNKDGIVSNDAHLEHAFAPEMMYYDGYFYIVASPSGNGHYIYRSRIITGPYEKVSGNIQEMIDGSFFVEKNEKKYFLRASETGITAKIFKDNDEKTDFSLFTNDYFNFDDTMIGGWTEGPYLLKRYDNYYLTYTGTHFLSDAYRVDYSSGKSLTKNGLDYHGTLLLSTDNDFYGLGHSMSFLGPNLDAYYIAYHNMMPSGNRYLNISRLMFNNYGEMLINGAYIKDNPVLERPLFETFTRKSDYLTKKRFSNNEFSIEFNFLGEDVKLYLSYTNTLNNQYFTFNNHILALHCVDDGKHQLYYHKVFKKLTMKNVYHNLRVQYKQNKMAIYLDQIELESHLSAEITPGRVGFADNLLKGSYLAYSVDAFGSSDIKTLKHLEFFATNCCQINDNYETDIKVLKSGKYALYACSKDNVVFNNVKINDMLLSDNVSTKFYNTLIGVVSLEAGINHFVFSSNTDLPNLKFHLEEITEQKKITMDDIFDYCDLYGRYIPLNNKIYFENDRNAILTKEKIFDYVMKTKIKIVGNPIKDDTFAGLIADCKHYAKVNQFENGYSLMGYMLVVNQTKAMVIDANFSRSKVLKKIKITKSKEIYLKIVKTENIIGFYVNDKKIYEIIDSKYICGRCGIYNNHASAIFEEFVLN